jgi:hypothetical protein
MSFCRVLAVRYHWTKLEITSMLVNFVFIDSYVYTMY